MPPLTESERLQMRTTVVNVLNDAAQRFQDLVTHADYTITQMFFDELRRLHPIMSRRLVYDTNYTMQQCQIHMIRLRRRIDRAFENMRRLADAQVATTQET